MSIPGGFLAYKTLVSQVAARYGYEPALLAAQAQQESGWRADAVSPAGAQGLCQFMPRTWEQYGRGGNPFDAQASLDACVRYMRDLRAQFGDLRLSLAAYNCGPGNVGRAITRAGTTAWAAVEPLLPAETRNYVKKIINLQGIFRTLGDIKATLPVNLSILLVFAGLILVRRLTA